MDTKITLFLINLKFSSAEGVAMKMSSQSGVDLQHLIVGIIFYTFSMSTNSYN